MHFSRFPSGDNKHFVKFHGGVRGIATRNSFRRLAKKFARQFVENAKDACSPFKFAFSTLAGTNCVVHIGKALADLNPNKIVIH